VDIGQGDATLIEADGAVAVIDGGPNSGFHKYLNKRQAAMRRADVAIGTPERERLISGQTGVSIEYNEQCGPAGLPHSCP